MIHIIGSYLSPYVRKVLVALELKGLPYEIDPIVPFMGDENLLRQMLMNLIENAVTHTPAGGNVVVELNATDSLFSGTTTP